MTGLAPRVSCALCYRIIPVDSRVCPFCVAAMELLPTNSPPPPLKSIIQFKDSPICGPAMAVKFTPKNLALPSSDANIAAAIAAPSPSVGQYVIGPPGADGARPFLVDDPTGGSTNLNGRITGRAGAGGVQIFEAENVPAGPRCSRPRCAFDEGKPAAASYACVKCAEMFCNACTQTHAISRDPESKLCYCSICQEGTDKTDALEEARVIYDAARKEAGLPVSDSKSVFAYEEQEWNKMEQTEWNREFFEKSAADKKKTMAALANAPSPVTYNQEMFGVLVGGPAKTVRWVPKPYRTVFSQIRQRRVSYPSVEAKAIELSRALDTAARAAAATYVDRSEPRPEPESENEEEGESKMSFDSWVNPDFPADKVPENPDLQRVGVSLPPSIPAKFGDPMPEEHLRFVQSLVSEPDPETENEGDEGEEEELPELEPGSPSDFVVWNESTSSFDRY